MTKDDDQPGSTTRHGGSDDTAAQAAMYRLMVENTLDLIIRYDAGRHRIYVSPSSLEMLGYAPEEMLGGYASGTLHPEDRAEIDATFWRVGPAVPSLDLTFRGIRKDGQVIWVEGRYRYLPEDGGILAVLRDITERRHAEEMLAEANETLEAANRILLTLAQQDGLTRLANRRRFDEALAEEFRRACRQAQPLSALLLDVDQFKAYNDRYGHLAGDECLRRISRAIEAVPQRPGDLVARYGGEEFVVLLPATEAHGAWIVAEAIRQAVAALGLEHLGSAERIVTVSIGMSSIIPGGDCDQPEQLVAAADQALYRAKAGGRNRVAGFQDDALATAG